jgi:tRNA (guanine37-N1)-methyltransferase
VYANDLNPSSYEYLCANIKLNRLGGKVLPFNIDGRAFMRQAAAGHLDVAAAAAVVPPPADAGKKQERQQKQQQAAAQHDGQTAADDAQPAATAAPMAMPVEAVQPAAAATSGSRVFHHIVMNLPAAAVEFLDALHGSFCPQLWQGQHLPLVHVYTFAKGEEELAGGRSWGCYCCVLWLHLLLSQAEHSADAHCDAPFQAATRLLTGHAPVNGH